MLSFSKSDKIMVVAPHPDDESLGTGGMLQRIFAQKVPVRIVFATNGENNPWAQRYGERRWKIGFDEKASWGQRRQKEALNAICALGGNHDCARFLNLPDLGLTDLLMRGGPDLSGLVADEIQAWEPTVALIPTIFDAHPDHSALSVAFSMALDSVGGSSIRTSEYLVHKPRVPIPHEAVNLLLSAEEVARKKNAILCHQTQVALSRKRFIDFARIEESYYPHEPIEAKRCHEPLATACLQEGVLSLQFNASPRERLRSEILFAFRSGMENEKRWRLPVPFRSGRARVWDTITNRQLHEAIVHWSGPRLSVEVPLPNASDYDAIYAKISGSTLFFDRSGWSQFKIPASRQQSHIRRANVAKLVSLL